MHGRLIEVNVVFQLDVGLGIPIDDFDDRFVGIGVNSVIDAIDSIFESTFHRLVDCRRRCEIRISHRSCWR